MEITRAAALCTSWSVVKIWMGIYTTRNYSNQFVMFTKACTRIAVLFVERMKTIHILFMEKWRTSNVVNMSFKCLSTVQDEPRLLNLFMICWCKSPLHFWSRNRGGGTGLWTTAVIFHPFAPQAVYNDHLSKSDTLYVIKVLNPWFGL